ncbi:unnamed protein product [Adineta steineri]|uniref:F-box domain-containing protein n=1 Tax=Adineta steineri TaxID=433720 RepID=A0A818UXF7_9BILA|nr:unnamed protein product [Adineta steineri]
MSSKTILSLHTLPVEMVYRILDNLNLSTIFWSLETVCQRLNAILDSYDRYKTLRSLDFTENGISDEGAQSLAIALKHNTTLTKLGLRCNNIQDQGALHLVNALQQNRTLITLEIAENKFSDETLDGFTFESSKRPTAMAWHLENAKRRIIAGRKLGLEWCHLRNADAQLLANALQENTTLISLSLRDNNIGDKGAKYLGEALRNNRTLAILDLEYNNISVQGEWHLIDNLQYNTARTLIYSY